MLTLTLKKARIAIFISDREGFRARNVIGVAKGITR